MAAKKKAAGAKKAVKKAAAKKAVKKVARKKATKKAVKKAIAKKVVKKKATKKAVARKVAATAKKAAVRKAVARKAVARKAAPKKNAPKKAAPKKTAPQEPAAPAVDVGMHAPDFSLLDDSSERVTLSDYRGKHVVLYFYPKDDTPGCTVEACSFRDNHGDVRALGAVVFGVSPDDRDSHVKFVDKFHLNFPLLVDEGAEVAKKYDVWKEKNMYGKKSMGIERSTFLIDRDGVIRRAWRRVKVEGHTDEVIAALREM
jgi:peroxiredoxin Q/BCP